MPERPQWVECSHLLGQRPSHPQYSAVVHAALGRIDSSMSDSPDPLSFTPVPTGSRHDGWTPARQINFIAAVSATGVVGSAARAVGMSRKSAYALRARPGSESFARAWDTALDMGRQRIWELVVDRAVNGVTAPRYYRGKIVGTRHHYDYRGVNAALSPPPGQR
jgi:hypothetical protein